jgi:hypothetical protein
VPDYINIWPAEQFWNSIEIAVCLVEAELGIPLPEGKVEQMILLCLLDATIPAGTA